MMSADADINIALLSPGDMRFEPCRCRVTGSVPEHIGDEFIGLIFIV